MRALRWLPFVAALACRSDPAELNVSLVGEALASAQYFHGNCFAAFSLGLDLHIQETRRVGVVVTRLFYRITDQGSGRVLVEEALDQAGFDGRFGARASVIPAQGTRTIRIVGVTPDRPSGPISVSGEIEAIDENDQRIIEPFQLSTGLVVDDPGPPEGGACIPP